MEKRFLTIVKNRKKKHRSSRLQCKSTTPGMSNMRPLASTPAARTKDTVIWSFNGQNCSFYNLNWINLRRSQKNSMLFFIQNVFYTWKYDRLFPSVKNILNKENSTAMQFMMFILNYCNFCTMYLLLLHTSLCCRIKFRFFNYITLPSWMHIVCF